MARLCSVDGGPAGRIVASGYWAWFPEPDVRVAYKLIYCANHADVLIDLIKRSVEYKNRHSPAETGLCAACGEDLGLEYSLTWCTAFIPGADRTTLTFEHCFTHATELWAELATNGEKLANRDERARAPEAESPWARPAWAVIESKTF